MTEFTRRGLLWTLAGAAAGAIAEPKKSFFFFDRISMPENSLRTDAARMGFRDWLSRQPLSVQRKVLEDTVDMRREMDSIAEVSKLLDQAGVEVTFDAAAARKLYGLPLSPNDVAKLCGLKPFEKPPGPGRASGKTTLMLCDAVAWASEGRFARISGWSAQYSRSLVRQAREMAEKCGVDPWLIGTTRVPPSGHELRDLPPGDERRLLGSRAKIFDDHFGGKQDWSSREETELGYEGMYRSGAV